MFAELLSVENVSATLTSGTKDAVLLELGELVARSIEGATSQSVRKVLADREALASTGVGSGVAIPHGRLAGLDRVRVGIGVHQKGVGFDAIDGRPVPWQQPELQGYLGDYAADHRRGVSKNEPT